MPPEEPELKPEAFWKKLTVSELETLFLVLLMEMTAFTSYPGNLEIPEMDATAINSLLAMGLIEVYLPLLLDYRATKEGRDAYFEHGQDCLAAGAEPVIFEKDRWRPT